MGKRHQLGVAALLFSRGCSVRDRGSAGEEGMRGFSSVPRIPDPYLTSVLL